MSLTDRINDDFNQALKQKDSEKLSALRLLRSTLKNLEIEKKQPLTDEEVVKTVWKEIKQRQDSIKTFQAAGRLDLVNKEQAEINIFQNYLPEEINDQELEALIRESISKVGAKSLSDLGKVMSAVMPKVAGRADGAKVSQKVKELLS